MKASGKTVGTAGTMGTPPSPQRDSYSLPSHDALAQILPLFLQTAPHQEPLPPVPSDQEGIRGRRRPVCVREEAPAPVTAPVTVPAQELQRYRDAMGRMAADMISLRAQVVALQSENSRLRAQWAEFEDPGLDLLRDTDLDVMTKAEMADRIVSLSVRLSSERSQNSAQSNRILHLQNQLIRKNDREKELLRLQRQSGFEQQEQRRRELEATVRQQGKVIKRMEKAQQSYNNIVKNKQKGDVGLIQRKGRAEMTSAAEDTGVRLEMFRASPPPPPPPHTQPAALSGLPAVNQRAEASLRDRLGLWAELERTETRRLILEKQLEENSKLWGRQKQQMLIRLNEHKHGLNQILPTEQDLV